MAYSSGFSPHPRISYANAAPTSAQSRAEYLEIALAEVCDPQDLAGRLNAVLPEGFRVVKVIEASKPSLGDLLEASWWRIDLGEPPIAGLAEAVDTLRAAESVQVTRHRAKGDRIFDARPAILAIDVADQDEVMVMLRHQAPLVRPDDVVAALRVMSPGLADDHPGLFTRECQGPVHSDGTIGDPLAVSVL